jgi:hypothetical protein
VLNRGAHDCVGVSLLIHMARCLAHLVDFGQALGKGKELRRRSNLDYKKR